MFVIRNVYVAHNIKNTFNLNKISFRELRGIVRHVEILETNSNKINIPNKEIEDISLNENFAENVNKHLFKIDKIPSPLASIDPENPHELVPSFVPTFNLAAYVNKSESLKELLKLGVNLSKIEKRKGLPEFILKLDFENDIKPHLIFLNDIGVLPENFGEVITKNPLIFKEQIAELECRIDYLEMKNFQPTQISRIVTKNPFWLMFAPQRIDNRLGFFQQNFKLNGNEVRYLATKQPRLITFHLESVRKSIFCIKEEMGFNLNELKSLLLSKPHLWMLKSDDLIERFDYIHNTMKISHQQIVQFPEILTSREFRVRQRHGFLKCLGKAQYDPNLDLYVSLKKLVEGTDQDFVVNIAKSDMKTYNAFLRTL